MNIQRINPAHLYDGSPHGLSHASVDDQSGLVFISGQVDWNQQFQVVHAGVREQAEGAVKNLLDVLAAANSSVDNVLQLRVFVRGELGEHMAAIAPVLAEYFGRTRPAVTRTGVASLASPDTLVEIEAIARVES